MNILASDIIERFYTFLWPMLRISALLMSAPIFSLRALNVRMRVLLAVALTWMIYPLFDWPVMDPVSPSGLVEVFNQLSIGLLMGLSLQVITAAILLAGQSISTAVGLSMAMLMDPNLGNVPVVAQFVLILASLIFVSLGGHTMLLALVVDHERPELQAQAASLVAALGRYAASLTALEDDLLARLGAASGDILEDGTLVDSLESTKATAASTAEKA